MCSRPQYALMLAAAVLFSAAGCKQSSAPKPAPTAQSALPTPAEVGGAKVVELKSTATASGDKPQFLTATVLPGRGMNVFEITAYIPGKGVVKVLASPSLAEAASKLNGGPGDEYGNASFSFGGAFLVPYPNRILGTLSKDKKTLTAEWHGKTVTLPANWIGPNPTNRPVAMHGLILNVKAQDVKVMPIPGGQQLTATIHAGDFGGHWFSDTDLEFTLSLTGDTFDAQIRAMNVGKNPEPIAIGWHPYFSIPSGEHAQARLHVPATQVAQVNNYAEDFPTGKILPVKGTRFDFNNPNGEPLDDHYLDDNWSNLKRTNGAVDVRLSDPADDYGVQVAGLAPEIRTVQVYSPPTAKFAAIEEQFNFSDPFGKEWHGMNTGMVTLKPGDSTLWHVQLSLFTPPYKK